MKNSYTEPIDNIGDLMTVEGFKACVEMGCFMDYDGYGIAVKDEKEYDGANIHPSELDKIPADATHIIWYNR